MGLFSRKNQTVAATSTRSAAPPEAAVVPRDDATRRANDIRETIETVMNEVVPLINDCLNSEHFFAHKRAPWGLHISGWKGKCTVYDDNSLRSPLVLSHDALCGFYNPDYNVSFILFRNGDRDHQRGPFSDVEAMKKLVASEGGSYDMEIIVSVPR